MHKTLTGKKSVLATTGIGLVLIIIAMIILFSIVRPFVNFDTYICVEKNKEWDYVDNSHVKVIYYVNGEKYENVLAIQPGTRGRIDKLVIYYNVDDPSDALLYRENYIAMTLVLGVSGAICLTFGIVVGIKLKKVGGN